MHHLAPDDSDVNKKLKSKGCYIMYNLNDFDFSKIAPSDHSKLDARHNTKMHEEEQKEADQIDSITKLDRSE